MTDVNAVISKADVRFFPELNASQIELTIGYSKGNALLRIPMDSSSMFSIFSLFNKDCIYDLRGQYCRLSLDENDGRIDGIKNILFDEFGKISDNPIA